VLHLSELRGKSLVTTMLLVGGTLNAIAGAGTGLVTTVAVDAHLRGLMFWSLGSLGHASWDVVFAVVPFALASLLLLGRLAAALNANLLGEAEAAHLGFDVERTRLWALLVVALMVGASVAGAGVIGFLGVVAPHVARLLVGANHKVLLPASALLGAALLLWADLLSRTLAAPSEVPLSLLTGLLGAPFFLWLLVHERGRAGV
jgi:iron complex transport system permease protein